MVLRNRGKVDRLLGIRWDGKFVFIVMYFWEICGVVGDVVNGHK